jgi:diguanylate cyclase (GGDEF)-like protein
MARTGSRTPTPILRVLLVEQPADASDAGGEGDVTTALAGDGTRFVVNRLQAFDGAVTEVATNRYDCAVVDLELLGDEALQSLRAADPALALVVVSDDTQDDRTIELLAHGVDGYLTRGHVDEVAAGRTVRFAVARKRAEVTRIRTALQDPLTGLPNRLAVEEHLGIALQRAERRGTRIALIFVDLPGLDDLTREAGHHAAEEVVLQVADRLREVARESDAVGRLDPGFVIVCEDLTLAISLRRLGARVEEVLAPPLLVDGQPVDVAPTLSFASGGPAQTPVDLLRRGAGGQAELAFGP